MRQPPGLSPLGCQGSACERLRLTGSLRAPPRELYSTALCVSRMGYASQPKLASSLHNKRPSFYSADRLGRWAPCGANINAACRRRPPLVTDATTFAPLGSMSLDFRVAMLPYKSSSLATPASLVGLWVLSIVPHDSTRKRRTDLPLRGRCRRQKGCISTGEARFACFPFAPKARLFGLIIRGGLHHL